MARYLITGGAGFIGSHVANALLSQGDQVYIIDSLATGFLENVPERAVFIEGQCQEEELYRDLASVKFDAILHIAAQSSGEISFDDPVHDLHTNTESTLRLINFGLRTGCRRFIYTSSMSVYRSLEKYPNSEGSDLTPLSFYGVGKLASEHYARIYQGLGLEPTILRLFNVYGPGQNLRNLRQGMVSIFLAQMIQNKRVIVKGSLERFRDFVYVTDVVRAFTTCLADNGTIGRTFNVATGARITVQKLLQHMIEIFGEEVAIETAPSTPGDIFGIWGDPAYFRSVAGFAHEVDLRKGLRNMFEWALKGKIESD